MLDCIKDVPKLTLVDFGAAIAGYAGGKRQQRISFWQD
jgi:hypothetical protein